MRSAIAIALILLNPLAIAQSTGLGEPVEPAVMVALDLIVDPSGSGLPEGGATAAMGEALFAEKCQGCHGPRGEGLIPLLRLAGGDLAAQGGPQPSVGNYWPYATTLFDFIRRAMPANAPKSLSADEVYAATAYVLYLNGLVAPETVINRETLPTLVMPNREGFIDFSEVLE